MIKKNIVLIGFAVLVLTVIGLFIFDFLYRTLKYENHLKDCPKSDKFCGLQIINLSLPEKYVSKMLEISEIHGKRIEIPRKHQKNISSKILNSEMPEINDYYSECSLVISKYIGADVKPLPNDTQNRMSLVVYEKEGDYIDWHFDTNHYEGRFFTLLVPITLEPTCGNYQYKDHTEKDTDVEINKGQAILFEGDKVYHRGKMLCKDQHRVILSMTFVTSGKMNTWNYTMNKIKEYGIYGQ
jgi:hypothetical protein